jgi:hypothetical protein
MNAAQQAVERSYAASHDALKRGPSTTSRKYDTFSHGPMTFDELGAHARVLRHGLT